MTRSKVADMEPVGCISEKVELVVASTDGKEVFANATEDFAEINLKFGQNGLDRPSDPTDLAKMAVYEINEDTDFDGLFVRIAPSGDYSAIAWTQSQVIEIVRTHRRWLREDGMATIFPIFVSGGWPYVACVSFTDRRQLRVSFRETRDSIIWRATNKHRVIVRCG